MSNKSNPANHTEQAHGTAASTGIAGSPAFDTPADQEAVTRGPLERELGEPATITEAPLTGGSLLSDGMSTDQREDHGIIDESRHTGSLGRR